MKVKDKNSISDGQIFEDDEPLNLECYAKLSRSNIAYQTFGTFKEDNVILICHHLTGNTNVTQLERFQVKLLIINKLKTFNAVKIYSDFVNHKSICKNVKQKLVSV